LLNQTAEYALRAMSCLAYEPDRLMPTNELAEFTKVPSNYLAKVLQSLAQADLIVGRRGVGGGYRLGRPADKISLLDVINAISPVERITECPLGLTNHSGKLCPLHRRLDMAAKQTMDTFGGITLMDVISERDASRPLCDIKRTAKVEMRISAL
jgi:Rrf2 family protein|tara:strand:- start:10233 stop:10694 length:462 start_codon:yes stop_codon:yes gene_type:complete